MYFKDQKCRIMDQIHKLDLRNLVVLKKNIPYYI